MDALDVKRRNRAGNTSHLLRLLLSSLKAVLYLVVLDEDVTEGTILRLESELGNCRDGSEKTSVGFLFGWLSLQWDISLPRRGEEGGKQILQYLNKQRKSASTRSQAHKAALRRILLNISISCCPASVARVQSSSLFASPSHHNSLVSDFQGAQVALSPASAADTDTCRCFGVVSHTGDH